METGKSDLPANETWCKRRGDNLSLTETFIALFQEGRRFFAKIHLFCIKQLEATFFSVDITALMICSNNLRPVGTQLSSANLLAMYTKRLSPVGADN